MAQRERESLSFVVGGSDWAAGPIEFFDQEPGVRWRSLMP